MNSTNASIPASSTQLTKKKNRVPIAQEQADVALCDMRDIQAMLRMGKSWVYAEIKAGRFPAPVIQSHRCTRFRLADIRKYLIDLAAKA